MKTTTISWLGRRGAWALSATLLFAHGAAQACPGCKQVTEGRGAVPLNGASIGFGLSIFFLIFMIVALLSGLGFMMYRSCQTLAARHRVILARMEAEESMSSAEPA